MEFSVFFSELSQNTKNLLKKQLFHVKLSFLLESILLQYYIVSHEIEI